MAGQSASNARPSAYRVNSCGTHVSARRLSGSRQISRTGRTGSDTTCGSRSRIISCMHLACGPCITCRPVVAGHHQPGPHRRPGTTGNAATGASCPDLTATAASTQRRCTSVPSAPANSASTAPGSGTRQALPTMAGKPSWLLSVITNPT